MQALRYPLTFSFKITTLANDFTATDDSGRVVAYVRQKMLRLKEDVQVYSDENRTRVNYHIRANAWIDFSAAYTFFDPHDRALGAIARKGWRSLWKADYEIIDQHEKLQFRVSEENAWVKVADGLLGQVPVVGWLTGYVFNPSYLVTDLHGRPVARLRKQPSFFGKQFSVDRLTVLDEDDEVRIMLGLMMLVLLERRRG